jgi:hypothetical protein
MNVDFVSTPTSIEKAKSKLLLLIRDVVGFRKNNNENVYPLQFNVLLGNAGTSGGIYQFMSFESFLNTCITIISRQPVYIGCELK